MAVIFRRRKSRSAACQAVEQDLWSFRWTRSTETLDLIEIYYLDRLPVRLQHLVHNALVLLKDHSYLPNGSVSHVVNHVTDELRLWNWKMDRRVRGLLSAEMRGYIDRLHSIHSLRFGLFHIADAWTCFQCGYRGLIADPFHRCDHLPQVDPDLTDRIIEWVAQQRCVCGVTGEFGFTWKITFLAGGGMWARRIPLMHCMSCGLRLTENACRAPE